MRERRSRRDQAYREARKLRRDAERDAFARDFMRRQSEYMNLCMEKTLKALQKYPFSAYLADPNSPP